MMINHDDKVDNSAVHEKRLTLLGKKKRYLRILAHSLGLKISFYLSPGQSSKELSKESMQLWIMKKEFEMEMIKNAPFFRRSPFFFFDSASLSETTASCVASSF
jgi:hypothetical protein